MLAGILIGSYAQSLRGIGLAFGIDAATFAMSAILLGLTHRGGHLPSAEHAASKESVRTSIVAGMNYVRQNDALRLMFFVIAAANFLFVGPIPVGIPVLADQRPAEGPRPLGCFCRVSPAATWLVLAEQVADEPSLDALAKMRMLLTNSHMGDEQTDEVPTFLHLDGNRELHEVTNIQTVLRLSPVFVKIVEQGNRESPFHAERPLETMQFLLTGAQFLLDGGLFEFSDEELIRFITQAIVEKALVAEPGTFAFMNQSG